MAGWNPWHGCHKFSEGCMHCYVYRSDERYGRDATTIQKTKSFYLPIAKKRNGEYKLASGTIVYTCFTSDFFVEDADEWRKEAWKMIKERSDLHFFMITKRIHRFMNQVPDDWGDGYANVTVCATMENQRCVDERMPIYKKAKIRHKQIICEPLLGDIQFDALDHEIEQVVVGGESGSQARICKFDWILHIREQCAKAGVSFYFKQTGAKFCKDQKLYCIQRRDQHKQAYKADININAHIPDYKT